MALLCNGWHQGHNPFKQGMQGMLTGVHNFHLAGRDRNIGAGEGLADDLVGVPDAALHPYSWLMPQRAGGMGSHYECVCEAIASAGITDGRVMVATSAGASVVTAYIDQGVFVVGTTAGVATNNSTLTFAPSKLVGNSTGTSTLTGTQTPNAWATGVITGTAYAELLPHAAGVMNGAVTPFTTLSPENLASTVWNTELLNYNIGGSAGRAMKTIKGLVHENFIMKDQVYDTNDRLVSATVRIFANATDCTNDVNPIDEYTISSSYGVGGVFRTVKI